MYWTVLIITDYILTQQLCCAINPIDRTQDGSHFQDSFSPFVESIKIRHREEENLLEAAAATASLQHVCLWRSNKPWASRSARGRNPKRRFSKPVCEHIPLPVGKKKNNSVQHKLWWFQILFMFFHCLISTLIHYLWKLGFTWCICQCVTFPLMDCNFHLECGLCCEVASLEVYTLIKNKKSIKGNFKSIMTKHAVLSKKCNGPMALQFFTCFE